jgi:hypothetical protein
VEAALREYQRLGCELRGAGIVVGSDVDPQTITNPHIRAHASEGRLFRRVTEDAVRGFGVSCSIWIEKTLYAAAAERLGWPESHLKQTVTAAGRNVAGGWRGDDKVATVAAWLALRG